MGLTQLDEMINGSISQLEQEIEYCQEGIADLGKNDWNDRLVLSNLNDLQNLIEIGDRYTGAFIKIKK